MQMPSDPGVYGVVDAKAGGRRRAVDVTANAYDSCMCEHIQQHTKQHANTVYRFTVAFPIAFILPPAGGEAVALI